MKKILIAGAGVAGLASSIRLSRKGFSVTVFEQANKAGGKLSELQMQGFRFDTGPSLFTMPWFVDELTDENFKLDYERVTTVCHYFFPDNSRFQVAADTNEFIRDASAFFKVTPGQLRKFLKKNAFIYRITSPVFLEKSLHKASTYLCKEGIRGILNLPRIGISRSMNSVNKATFKDKRLVQYFNRFATYNGSHPGQAPSTLNVISHLENHFGAYYPKGGMIEIPKTLYKQALHHGVKFQFGSKITSLNHQRGRIQGLTLENGEFYEGDALLSNLDVRLTHKLLNAPLPKKIKEAEPSSSAFIFLWGIRKTFPELGLHNIFFANDYDREFDFIFKEKSISDDVTVYVNITAKMDSTDAPAGCENWFVLVNAPANIGQNQDELRQKARMAALKTLSARLGTEIQNLIVCEEYLDPIRIEKNTGSTFGSLYGSSSNSRMSAFFRQANFSQNIKGLYFCGGSVHPGGGIPLCLLGGKIASEMIEKDYGQN
jgi:phytoene desaturase